MPHRFKLRLFRSFTFDSTLPSDPTLDLPKPRSPRTLVSYHTKNTAHINLNDTPHMLHNLIALFNQLSTLLTRQSFSNSLGKTITPGNHVAKTLQLPELTRYTAHCACAIDRPVALWSSGHTPSPAFSSTSLAFPDHRVFIFRHPPLSYRIPSFPRKCFQIMTLSPCSSYNFAPSLLGFPAK